MSQIAKKISCHKFMDKFNFFSQNVISSVSCVLNHEVLFVIILLYILFILLAGRPCQLVCGTATSAYYFGNVQDSTACVPGKPGSICIQGECKVKKFFHY